MMRPMMGMGFRSSIHQLTKCVARQGAPRDIARTVGLRSVAELAQGVRDRGRSFRREISLVCSLISLSICRLRFAHILMSARGGLTDSNEHSRCGRTYRCARRTRKRCRRAHLSVEHRVQLNRGQGGWQHRLHVESHLPKTARTAGRVGATPSARPHRSLCSLTF